MTLTILLQSQNQFFTIESMLTLTGATGVVYVVSNGIQHAFNYNPKWLALLISLILALVGVFVTNELSVTISDVFIGVINGFLIYSTSVGANQITGPEINHQATAKGRVENKIQEPRKRKFNSRWF